MFEQNTTALKSFTRVAFLLAVTAGLVAGGENLSVEGTWIAVAATPMGNVLFTQTVSPLDSTQTRFSSTMEPVNENPTHFGLFPQADGATNWVGHVVQTDVQSYEGTFVSYLTQMGGQSKDDPPLSKTIAILLLTTTLELTDPNAWAGEATIAAYRADQDTDQDGLPDDGQSPVDCSTFTCTAKRLGLMPPCKPKDPSETIEVTVGEEFVISLDSNPSTGYSWEVTSSLPAWLELIGSEYIPTPTDPPVIGGGGTEEWTFRANAAGTATVTFEYRRPWEKDQPPAQRKTFVIVARVAGEQIEVTVGEEFVISLDSNPTTGYSWEVTSSLPAWLELIGSEYIPTSTDPPGSGGTEEWTFRANDAGTATVTFEYRQPWATNDPPAQRKTFVIVARL